MIVHGTKLLIDIRKSDNISLVLALRVLRHYKKYAKMLLVYRINTSTNVTIMENLLKPHFPEVLCENFKSCYPGSQASLKVRIYQENFG